MTTAATHTVSHPSGETSTRTSAATYTHAVVTSALLAPELERATEHLAAVKRAIEIGALKPSEGKAAAKRLARLEAATGGATYTVSSWHESEAAATRKRRLGETVVEVSRTA